MSSSTPAATSAEAAAVALYRQLRHGRAATVDQAATMLGLDSDQKARACAHLQGLGLVAHGITEPSDLVHIGPEVALVRLLVDGVRDLGRFQGLLAGMEEAVSRLVGEYLPLGGVQDNLGFEEMADERRVAAYVSSAAALARSEILMMNPRPAQDEGVFVPEGLSVHSVAGRNLRLRSIVHQRATTVPHMNSRLADLAAAGVRFRTADVVPLRMIVFDRQRAVLSQDSADGTERSVAVEGETLCRSLAAFHDFCWQASQSLDTSSSADRDLTGQERAVLRMLAAGLKDEKIARSLGVSPRTVTRVVYELSQRIGAESRFQAGVEAVRMGWIA